MVKKKIFLASSSELKEDRDEFEILINRINKKLTDRNAFLELILWEDFLDAVSRTRLQDEYNQAVRDCDVFVMLFCTKVGEFTEEEFESAFGQFKATNKPHIFTYFKDTDISIGSANQTDLTSLWAFQKKLRVLGHFQTTYKNIDQLKFHFSQQLDKLALFGPLLPGDDLNTELSTFYRTILGAFRAYLVRIGFAINDNSPVRFTVVDGDYITDNGAMYLSLYDGANRMMKVASKYSFDTDLILHEYMHYALGICDRAPVDIEKDSGWWTYYAVESGLAVYFPCSFSSRSTFGQTEDISRSLVGKQPFHTSARDYRAAVDEGDAVWGQAFWEIRELLGQTKADCLLCSAWRSWKPVDPKDLRGDFVRTLIESHQSDSGEAIASIFRDRGLEI
jgi:hypothetical protein